MKYVLKIDSREGYEKVEMFAPSVGIQLNDDEARRVIRHAAEHYGIALQDSSALRD